MALTYLAVTHRSCTSRTPAFSKNLGHGCGAQLCSPKSHPRRRAFRCQKNDFPAHGYLWWWNCCPDDLSNFHLQSWYSLLRRACVREEFERPWGTCWHTMPAGVWPKDQSCNSVGRKTLKIDFIQKHLSLEASIFKSNLALPHSNTHDHSVFENIWGMT